PGQEGRIRTRRRQGSFVSGEGQAGRGILVAGERAERLAGVSVPDMRGRSLPGQPATAAGELQDATRVTRTHLQAYVGALAVRGEFKQPDTVHAGRCQGSAIGTD